MDGLDKLWNALPILIVNGATLLIVVVMMIRRGAKLEDRLVTSLTFAITQLKDEIIGLRRDVRETNTAAAVAIGVLTERVSRIEGMLLVTARDHFAGLEDEVTPVSSPIPRPTPPKRQPTSDGSDNVYVDPSIGEQTAQGQRRTPASGVPRVGGGYSMGKPRPK